MVKQNLYTNLIGPLMPSRGNQLWQNGVPRLDTYKDSQTEIRTSIFTFDFTYVCLDTSIQTGWL